MKVPYEKYVRDGKVAVLVSLGYGAGWSTWNREHEEFLLFDRELVELVLAGKRSEAGDLAESKVEEHCGEHDCIYTGGSDNLHVAWVVQGESFRVSEYDGSESLQFESEEKWVTA